MNKPKILIVDDIIENLLTLEAVLGDFDVEFVKALSGNEALALCLDNDFALAIIDIQMPEMDGYETVKIMRQIKRTRNLPIIYVSAIYKEEFHVEKGIEVGAVDFIIKPIPPKIIIGKVKIFLELYDYRTQLEHLVEKRTQELKNANQELSIARDEAEHAARSKSVFLATMSHEIRTPLNGIIGMTHLLQGSQLNDEQKELLDIITVSGDNLLGIINDILDYSKIESRMIDLEKIPFSLTQTVEEIIRLLKLRVDEKGLDLYKNIHPSVPDNLIGDPLRLKQVLINLVSNAVKFTERGTITIHCETVGNDNNRVELKFRVVDTGIGISDEGKDKLFKEFSQVDASTTRIYGGSGLGLAISKHLSQLMGGTIGVESTPGEGSDFWFTAWFDLAQDIVKSKSIGVIDEQLLLLTSLKVLLVEDNYINQKVARYTLEKVGVACDVADNGEKAVEMYRLKKYDIILMDLMMPVKDGYEATSEIRSLEKKTMTQKPVRIVAMTANAMKEDRDLCLACGMDDFISKPFNIQDLKRILTS
jgi:two-component system, sensor histidine kinase